MTGIDPIIVKAYHNADSVAFNTLVVSVDEPGHVEVKPYTSGYMEPALANAVLASNDIDPKVLGDGKKDALIAFQTSAGEIYTIYDDGTTELSGKSPKLLTGIPATPTSSPPTPAPVQPKRGLPGDLMDTGQDQRNGAVTLPKNVREGIDQ